MSFKNTLNYSALNPRELINIAYSNANRLYNCMHAVSIRINLQINMAGFHILSQNSWRSAKTMNLDSFIGCLRSIVLV